MASRKVLDFFSAKFLVDMENLLASTCLYTHTPSRSISNISIYSQLCFWPPDESKIVSSSFFDLFRSREKFMA